MINKFFKSKKIDSKFLFLVLAILGVILCYFTIQTTYAQYVSSLPQTSHVTLGSWMLTINNQNIIENSNISELVVPQFYNKLGDEQLATENKIVPTSTAYIELVLDYSKVTTPFKYELTFSQTNTEVLKDLKMLNLTIDDTLYTPENNSITINIDPKTSTSQTIHFNICWDDSESQTMDDILDTKYANTQITNLALLLNMKFTQLT